MVLEHLDKHIKSVNKRTNPSSTLRYDVTFSDGSGFVAYVTRDSSMIHFLFAPILNIVALKNLTE